MAIDPITALNGISPPRRGVDSSDQFNVKADALLGAFPLLVSQFNTSMSQIPATVLGVDFTGTSSTSVAIATGSKSFTASSGKNWYIGQAVRVSNTATPTNFMDGQVTAYNSGTGALTVSVSAVGGTGTFAAWTIGPAIGASNYATLSGVEALTNKTFTTPVLSGTSAGTTAGRIGYSGGVYTGGNGSAELTFVTTSSTQTLSNKTFTAPAMTSPSVTGGMTISTGGLSITGGYFSASNSGGVLGQLINYVGDVAPPSSGTASTGTLIATGSTGRALNIGVTDSGQYCWFNSAFANSAGTPVEVRYCMGGAEYSRVLTSGVTLFGATASAGLVDGTSVNPGVAILKSGQVAVQRNDTVNLWLTKASGYADGSLAAFQVNGAIVGSISTNGTATAYNTASDYRLKMDLRRVEDPVDRLMQIKVWNFAWKADGSRTDGFLAHEIGEVVPGAASGVKDGMRAVSIEIEPERVVSTVLHPERRIKGEDGEEIVIPAIVEHEVIPAKTEEQIVPAYQGVDQSKLVPLVIAALQDVILQQEAMAADLAALRTRVAELAAAR